jgi:predicted acylesterase/phospholipase RssA
VDYSHFLTHTVLREWVWEQFIHGFCVHLVRPLVLLLVFAITFLGLGRSFGLPALFLRAKWHERFLIGAGVGVLAWQAVLAGYLFEEFATNYTIDRPPFCEVRPVSGPVWPWETPSAKYELDLNAKWYDDMRYRHVPADVWSILLYGRNVAAAAGVFVLLLAVTAAVRWVFRKATGSRPTTKWGLDFAYFRIRFGLVLGAVVGFAVAAGVAWVFLPGQFVHDKSFTTDPTRRPVEVTRLHEMTYRVGGWLVNLGGWGNAAARDAAFAEFAPDDTDAGPPKDQADTRTDARYKLEPYYPVYGVFFLGFVALLLWNVFLLVFGQKFSPAAGILLLLHLLLAGQTFIDYFFAAPTLVLLVVCGLLVVFAGRYRMRFPGLERYYTAPLSLQVHYDKVRDDPMPPPGPPGPTAVRPADFAPLHTSRLARWNDGSPKRLVVVCASGGGSRAAAWTMKVLTTLEQRLPDFPYHIRLITGASGGMFGASYYTASLPPPGSPRVAVSADPHDPPAKASSGAYPNIAQLNDSIRGDFLTPVVRDLVKNDLLRPFVPFAWGGDRGAAIEAAWSGCLGGWLDRTFADLWADELAGWRPSLAFSPMMVEDGRQLVISNLSFRRALTNLGRMPGGTADAVLSREGVEFFKLFESCGYQIPDVRKQLTLATAARMSASFPYLFPAVPLPTHPRRRVVDAGYYDNYGVCLAAAWLFNHIGWLKANVSGVAVVHIRDGVSTAERLMETPAPDARTAVGLAAEGLTTPPAGLNASRTAASTFRNDNLLHLLNQFFREHGVPFATAAVEFPGGNDVSLNFTLPPDEAALIDGPQGIDHPDVQSVLRAIERWW